MTGQLLRPMPSIGPDVEPEPSARRVIAMPPIIGGKVLDGPCEDVVVTTPDASIVTRFPTERDLELIETGKRELGPRLRALSLRDVSLFLHRVGSGWLDRLDEIGREYGAAIEETTGLNWSVVRSDYAGIGGYLTSRADHYQLLRSELGSVHAMDEWQRNESVRQLAVPRGMAFHSLVGNIPVAGLYSVLRGMITRNANLIKLPSRDPLSVYLFARTAVEVAGDSPLAAGISALYWPREHEVGNRLIGLADTACLWGSGEAISQVRSALRPNVPCVTFGPRRSCAVLDLTADGVDLDDAARRLAIEVSFYNQAACLSPLRAYVLGDAAAFEERLAAAMHEVTAALPRRAAGTDVEGQIRLISEEARVRGWSVHTGDGWSSIRVSAEEGAITHPLGRTVFVHPCADLDEIAQWLDDDSQTISVYPYEAATTVAERLLPVGGSRVVELGLSRHPRRGFPHDGQRVLNSLVRWIAIEDDMANASIYGVLSAEELHRHFMGL
ncbi:acyl-CoA reductase [Dactylosporangium sp. NPDC051541]|uniref:acyl-CoA reductase n=1 Tax=Dactylosporangium sp. NPDC051541 TaxID=3363977 RepID=UPI00379F6617